MNRHYIVIAGTFKSGTSSLYTYLNQVEKIHGSSVKETGFFVPARYNLKIPDLQSYLDFFPKSASKDEFFMEASPGYLYGGKKIAESIKTHLGEDVKILFLLREPVERFLSFYKMLRNQNVSGVPTVVSDEQMSAETYFNECVEYSGIPDEKTDYIYHGLKDGNYVDYLKEWYEVFPKEVIKIVFFDTLTNSPESVVLDVLNWLDMDKTLAQSVSYRPVNQFRSHKNSTLQRFAMKINTRFESYWRKNEKLKQRLVRIYERLNTRNDSNAEPTEIIKKLHDYYTTKNKELHDFLKTKGYSDFPNWLS